jgi:hypothetical protein
MSKVKQIQFDIRKKKNLLLIVNNAKKYKRFVAYIKKCLYINIFIDNKKKNFYFL